MQIATWGGDVNRTELETVGLAMTRAAPGYVAAGGLVERSGR